MAGKPGIPRLFPPAIRKQQFERRILKRVALRDERAFLTGLYQLDETENSYRRPDEPDQEQIKRLRAIASAVRHNRGVLQPAKLALIGVVAAVAAAFVLLFADALVERAATRGLESLVQARVEFSQLRVRPLQPGLSFDSLSVANPRKPFRNLFELGFTEVRLDLGQLLRGKLLARNIETREFRWDTRREVSGALPAARTVGPADEPAAALELPRVDQMVSERFAEIDPEELIRSHFNELRTPALLAELGEGMQADLQRYRGDIPQLESRARAAAEQAQSVSDINPGELRSVGTIREAYRTVENAYAEVDGAAAAVQELRDRAQADLQRYREELAAIGELTAADLAYLQDLVPDFRLADVSAIAAFVLPELYEPLNERYEQVLTVWRVVDRLRARERATSPAYRREGRVVEYPARDYPRVLFERIAFSAGDRAARDLYEITAAAISSSPEIVDAPSSVQLTRYDEDKEVAFSAILDMRTGRTDELDLASRFEGYRFEIGERSGMVSFEGAEGRYNLETKLQLGRSSLPTGTIRLGIEDLQLAVPQGDRIAASARDILYSVPRVTIDLELRDGGRFRASSNLDEPFLAELRGVFEERRAAVQHRVADELDRRLSAELQAREQQIADMAAYRDQVHAYLVRVRGHRSEVAAVRDRLERRTAELEDEAERRVRQAAEQARREAEQRARQEAERQIDRTLDRFR